MATLISKTVKGHQYWYIVESKRIGGKVKQEVIEYIGNQKKLSEYLLNSNARRLSDCLEQVCIKSYSHGDTYALMKISEKFGIKEILDAIFKKKTRNGIERSFSLILAAVHRASFPGSKNEFASWFQSTSLPFHLNIKPQVMTSMHFWDQMDGISENELMAAEDAITKRILGYYDIGIHKVALDYTNYFTYISSGNDRNTLAKRGRNKQKRYDLRQCSLAIITSKDLGIPLFSHVYEGNTNDQTEFREYVKLLRERMPSCNPEEVTLVFDGGSNTKENLNSLSMHYICSFSLSYCKELYQIDLTDYREIHVNGREKKAFRTTRNIWGQERECILTFSQSLYDGQLRELELSLINALGQIEELNKKIQNPKSRISKEKEDLQKKVDGILKNKHSRKIIETEIAGETVAYRINEEEKAIIIHCYFGKKLIITDRKEWSTEDILTTYYEQDCVEKLFQDTKNSDHFSIQPIYHWTDQKIRVHIFICLLGLTLSTLLQKEVGGAGGVKISKNRLMEELGMIRESWVGELDGESDSKKVIRRLEKMNDMQEMIWQAVEKI